MKENKEYFVDGAIGFINEEIRSELWNMFTENQKNYIKNLVENLEFNEDDEAYGIVYLFGNRVYDI